MLLAGLLLVSCQRKPPSGIELESATINREEGKVVCRVSLSNPKADSSDRVSLRFSSATHAEAVATFLKFPRGENTLAKSFSGFVIEGAGPCESVIYFDGDSIPDDQDLSQGKLDLTFLSYSFDSGEGRDFETAPYFEVTFDSPEPGEE